MFHALFAKAPLIVVTAILFVVGLAVMAKLGVGWAVIVAMIMFAASCAMGFVLYHYYTEDSARQRQVKQMRFLAERFQGMLRTLPGGYCLFTPQGLLREEEGFASRLGLEKLGHFDDIVGAIKEGAELIQSFRRLQLTGDGFALQIHGAHGPIKAQLSGRRFQIGRDGPFVDMLWLSDHGAAAADSEKQAEALARARTTARLVQMMIDALPFPVWARAKDLRIIMCNKAYAKALDTSPADVVKDQKELMSQTARGGSGRTLPANALAKMTAQTERRHVIMAGMRRLLEITEMPVSMAKTDASSPDAAAAPAASGDEARTETPDAAKQGTDPSAPADTTGAQGGPSADGALLMGFAIDVTREEEKETELNRHLAAHHEVMEHLGAAIAVYGADTRLEFYNRAYLRLWETEESFLDTKPTMAEVLEDLRTRRRLPEQADFQRYKKDRLGLFTSLLEPQEDLMYLPDGTTLRILAAPHPLGGIMFVHEDVTDRLALESSYNTLIAVQRETLDNLAEGIAVFGSDGKLRLSNPAFARIWKLEQEFLLTEPHVGDLLEQMKPLFNYGENWPTFKAEMVSYTLDRNMRTGRIERADQMVISFSTVPLPDGAVLNSYLDVTDSVRVEQALRASNAALATADRLKSEFVANVSYQLRTPLNTITGFAEILGEQYFGALNPKQLEYTQTIKAEGEKLTRLINDVLDLATIEAGRMNLSRRPVAVADLLNDAKHMTAEWARQQSLDIMIDCPSDIGSFDVDEQRMKQILFNLISNAIKYTPSGGRIVLTAARRADWIDISVMDTGVGIPEADRDRVFGKFERANPEMRQYGAGLGLSLVKSFVELHGGRIEMRSDLSRGTTVTCYLPIHAPPESDGTSA